MTILWCGGEDIDFREGDATYLYSNNSDVNFARTALSTSGISKSKTFTPVSSLWLSCQMASSGGVNRIAFGLCKSGTNAYLLLGVGSNGNNVALNKYDGTTITKLAEGSSSVWNNKIDMQVVNYGSSGNVKVYSGGLLQIDYNGNIAVLSQTTLDQVALTYQGGPFMISEVIVADEDTRLMRLKTLAPDSAGDTNEWTGSYQDIDEITLSDSDKIYSATNDADFQCNLTGMPSGSWSVRAVKVAARCVDGSGTFGIQIGCKSGGTVDSGVTQNAPIYFETKERLMTVNPVTGNAWTPAEIASLQINLRAKAV